MLTLITIAYVKLPNVLHCTTTVRYGTTSSRKALFDLLDVLVAAFGECAWGEGTSVRAEGKREKWRREWSRRDKVIPSLTASGACSKNDFVELEWMTPRRRRGELRYRVGATPRGCIAYLNTQISKHSPRERVQRVTEVLARLHVARDQGVLWRPNSEELVNNGGQQ